MPDLQHNPDVLSCLANLSSDEVFTPPEVANAMLDMLPKELWKDSKATFLDPACKSGVFLREIAKRLIEGLKDEIPDLQARLDHIFQTQLYGIAITDLTALLSRRSLYGSKWANGKYSFSRFETADGLVRLNKKSLHVWKNSRCEFCGASQSEYDRDKALESHAYEFIHTHNPEKIFNMKFDVIIGNPPYQLNTAGNENGAQAKPLYHIFVQQALSLMPKYVVMIIPSRWFSGGWGLDEFRNKMMYCDHIYELHDFQNSSDCFSGVDIKGGVSYFAYSRNQKCKCKFYSHESNNKISLHERFLHEEGCEVVIRYNQMISIYRKVHESNNFSSFENIVSGRSPYGLNTNHYGHAKQQDSDIKYFERKGMNYISKNKITKNIDSIDKYKIFIPKTAEDGKLPGKVIGGITYGFPGVICSGTYLLIGPFDSESHMKNVASYMKTKFFRCLVAINKISQDAYAKVYNAVPIQDFSKPWTDAELYAKYGLDEEEIAFIESMIKPMELEA